MILRLIAFFLVFSPMLVAQRLPLNAVPEHYALFFEPNIKAATFTGSETIDLALAKPSASITLNAIELEISSASANGVTGTVSYDPAKEQATFTFPQPLPAGRVVLQTAFRGILNDKLRGFYLSKTAARSYAVTQFESTDARRAFPSFDEPALKSTFSLSLMVDARDNVISNSTVLSDKPAAGGKHLVSFSPTPKMSTYLVAFLVGDFRCTSGKAEGVPIRVCSTPDKVELTHFALEAAKHFLAYYNNYFGIRYPMPKLDLIGIPDFEAGAMENFGAITYRETDLLLDDKDSSINARKHVASVVAHEMAHQWFGDMVTMQWWDNLWLNEGFATWMQDKAANDWHPEWNFPQDVASALDDTLNYDAARTTRPIRASAETPAQISEMFDGIAYGKAGAVIGMIESWVGPELFQRGVHNYLAAHLYGNATAEDFWNAQTSTSHQPVDEVMASFVDLPGVPLITLNRENTNEKTFSVAQTRFFLDPVGGRDEKTNGLGWKFPICLKTNAGPQCQLVRSTTATLSMPSATPFLYANALEKGYFRVAYRPSELKAIVASAGSLTVAERIGFLGDRWALIRAGQGNVGDYLDLALALKDDPNAQVLDSMLSTVSQIRNRIASDDDRTKMNALIRAQYGPVYQALGPASAQASEKASGNSLYDQQQIRTDLYETLGTAGDPAIVAHAREVTEALLAGKKVAEPDIVDASVGLAAATGDADFYDRILLVSQKATDPGLQSEALQVLTRFRDPALVLRTLEYATSGKVRNQDSWILLAVELSQRETRAIAWPWIQAHWDAVSAQLTTGSGSQLVSATGSFCSASERKEVAGFFAKHKVEAADRAVAKALDGIDACIRLRETQEPKLKVWLASKGQ